MIFYFRVSVKLEFDENAPDIPPGALINIYFYFYFTFTDLALLQSD